MDPEEKAEQIQEMINDPEFSFKEIAEELGFSSSPHLTTYCQRMFGMTPSQLREKIKINGLNKLFLWKNRKSFK